MIGTFVDAQPVLSKSFQQLNFIDLFLATLDRNCRITYVLTLTECSCLRFPLSSHSIGSRHLVSQPYLPGACAAWVPATSQYELLHSESSSQLYQPQVRSIAKRILLHVHGSRRHDAPLMITIFQFINYDRNSRLCTRYARAHFRTCLEGERGTRYFPS
jgi:hypothetical protein